MTTILIITDPNTFHLFYDQRSPDLIAEGIHRGEYVFDSSIDSTRHWHALVQGDIVLVMAARKAMELPPLSPRERFVLRGLARGKTYKQLAAEINVHPNTVKTYASSLRRKLATQTDEQLVGRAVNVGLLRLDGDEEAGPGAGE